jgi:hypothetical protein
MPVLRTAYPQSSPVPTLLVMAGGDHHGKRPQGMGSHRDVCPASNHQARMDVSPSRASLVFRWVSDPRRCSSRFACFVVTLNPTRCLIQGSLGSSNQAGGDCGTAGTTLGAGEGAA